MPVRRTCTARRRGVSTFESILVLVVLIIASFAAFQFGLALIVKQTVSHAATVAAREASKGADADELICVVNRLFQEYRMQIGPDVSLILEDPTAAIPIEKLPPDLIDTSWTDEILKRRNMKVPVGKIVGQDPSKYPDGKITLPATWRKD